MTSLSLALRFQKLTVSGHGTTTEFSVWATHALASYPHVAKRLREEVAGLLRQSPNPDYADLEGLPYLNNFTREVLRLQPPGMLLYHPWITGKVASNTPVGHD